MRRIVSRAVFGCAMAALFAVCGCGSDSNDNNSSLDNSNSEEFYGAGQIDLSAEPQTIDTGDRLRVYVRIENAHPDGIILKLQYPAAFKYVQSSAKLQTNRGQTEVGPSFDDPEDSTPEAARFLVFFLAAEDFDKTNSGVLTFELQAIRSLTEGEIGVDADVDDPAVENPGEFDIGNPQYQPEASVTVSVKK